MSCCCHLLCLCRPEKNTSGLTTETLKNSNDFPVMEKVVASITQDLIVATDGSTYSSSQWINLRPGQTFLVDPKGYITGRLQPNRPSVRPTPQDDMLIMGSPKSYAGSSQTPAHIRMSGMYGTYDAVSHDFVISPILDPVNRAMATEFHLTSLTDPGATGSEIGLLELQDNMAADGTIDNSHRYSIDRTTEKCNQLQLGYYTSVGGVPPLGSGDESIPFPIGYGALGSFIRIESAPEPTSSADWGAISTSYPLMRWQTPPSGTSIDTYWVDPGFSRFDLNTGTTTVDAPVSHLLGSAVAGWVKVKFYFWDNVLNIVDVGESGAFYKDYYMDFRNPYPIPKIEIHFDIIGRPGLQRVVGIWMASDAQITSGVDVEANYLPARYIPWAYGYQSSEPYWYTLALIPGALSSPPSWTNTENYVYKSKVYPAGSYVVYPYTGSRGNLDTYNIENLSWFKADVNGVEVTDRFGNNKMNGWTHFNYGESDSLICVIFTPFDSDHIIVYESNGGSFNKIFVDVADLPFLSYFGVTSAYKGYAAIGHKNERNHNGLIDFNTIQIRFGAYDPYHDSSAERWKQFGVKRPASKADYDAYVAAGILAGKTLYELVPPPYNPDTIVHPKDFFFFSQRPMARISPSSSDSAKLPIDLQKITGPTTTVDASADLPKIAKKMYLQNAWPDETDDKTGITGKYIARFNLSDVLQKDGCVLMGRYMGDISTLIVRVMSDDLSSYGPQFFPQYNGIWDYPVSYPVSPMPEKKGQYRTFACPIDVDSFDTHPSDVYVYVEAKYPLSQLILWVQ
mgnify:FL=1